MTAEQSNFIFEAQNKVYELVMQAFSSGVNYGYQLQKEFFLDAIRKYDNDDAIDTITMIEALKEKCEVKGE